MSKAALLTALNAALVAALHPTGRPCRICATGGGDFLCVVVCVVCCVALCVALRNNALSICALIVLFFVLFVVLFVVLSFVLLGA